MSCRQSASRALALVQLSHGGRALPIQFSLLLLQWLQYLLCFYIGQYDGYLWTLWECVGRPLVNGVLPVRRLVGLRPWVAGHVGYCPKVATRPVSDDLLCESIVGDCPLAPGVLG